MGVRGALNTGVACRRCGEDFYARRSDTLYCVECRPIVRKEYLKAYDHGKRKDACPQCGSAKVTRAALCRPCNNLAQPWRKVSEDNGNWKNGRSMSSGYVFVRISHKSGAGAYRPEHCLVWEEANGPIPKGWVVHHLNGVKTDNRLENLAAMPRNSHHPDHLTKPYQKRIRELEVRLSNTATEHQIGNSLDFTAMKTLGGNRKGDEDA